MSQAVVFRCADENSAGPAAELLDATPMSGLVRLTTRRPAGLFPSLRAEGRRRDVIVACEPAGGVAAVGIRNEKDCWVDGRISSTGYLSALRVREGRRGGLVLARGYRYLRQLHLQGGAPFYLTMVFEDNREALKLLSSGRAGLPLYEDWGAITTSLVDPRRAARPTAGGPRIESMKKEHLPALLELLRVYGSRRQFFPAYEAADFGSELGLLPGLEFSDILLAWDGNGLQGCAGLWDQSRFKSWTVAGYGFPLRPMRAAFNLWARWRRQPSWPIPGRTLKMRSVALFCVRDGDDATARALWRAAVAVAAERGTETLAWSLHERDPLSALTATTPRAVLRSRLFLVRWPEDGGSTPDRARVPYVETGAL